MPRSRSRGRWFACTSMLALLMGGGVVAEDAKPQNGSVAGETPHTPSPPSGATPESLPSTPPPASMSNPPRGDLGVPPTTTPEPPRTEQPPASPKPKETEPPPPPPPPLSTTPVVTPVPTEAPASPPPTPSTSMDANATKPSTTPRSTATTAAPSLSIPTLETPNSLSEMPSLAPTSTAALLPKPTVPSDTIDFVAAPVTTVPVPSDSSTSTSSAERSNVVSYSLAGGASLIVVLVLVVFLIVRRSREKAVKHREERTLAMSEMFLSSTTHREPASTTTPNAHVLRVGIYDQEQDPYVDSNVSHEVEDDAFSQVTILPSPGSIDSDPSDSYRSSYMGDENSSLSGFFNDDAPPLSGSSARSSSFFGHNSEGDDSDMDL